MRIKRKLLLTSFIALAIQVNSQVGINTDDPKTTFDVSVKQDSENEISDNTENYGVSLPTLSRLELTQNTAVYGNLQKGAMIYVNDVSAGTAIDQRLNINSIGYYYFDGSVWKNVQTKMSNTILASSIIDPNVLGYTPSSLATASTAAEPTIVGKVVTKLANIKYDGNGHTYAAYSTNNILTWYEAYNAAKSLGGYLATFTDDKEWEFVETNLIDPQSHFNTYSGWIGFARFSWAAGSALVPNPEMKWITGEKPFHDYTLGENNSVRKSNWFASGEPNSNTAQGFVLFFKKERNLTQSFGGYTSSHVWIDTGANDTGTCATCGNIRGFIVEFQQ